MCCDACDICDGTRGQRSLADGSIDEVLELSAKGLEIAVAEHPLVLVLLYAPKWFMDERERRLLAAFGQAAQAARREALPAALARVDIDQFPSVAAALQVPRAALPTLRLLRGSVGYGSEWRRGRLRGAVYDAGARTAVAARQRRRLRAGGRHLSRRHQIRNGAARRQRCTG